MIKNFTKGEDKALFGRRVLIMGLGLHGGGLGAVRYFASRGAKVTVTDVRDAETLKPSMEALSDLEVEYVLGEHRESDFKNADLIIKNPGVPSDSLYLEIARKNNVEIKSDAGVFLNSTSSFVIGVTGTKGKTTTTTMIFEGLSALGVEAELVSTPSGTSFFDALSFDGKESLKVSVCEFSSWDLEGAEGEKISPSVAVITNLFPDHLDRHKTMEKYAEAKSLIFRFQNPNDSLIIPSGDSSLKELSDGMRGQIVFTETKNLELPELRMRGEHNLINAALAIGAIKAALNHPKFPKGNYPPIDKASEAIAKFKGLSGRFELADPHEGRTVINDTTATNPGAALAALHSTDGPVVLIAGGASKGLSYDAFARAIAEKVKHVIFLPGDASEMLEKLLSEHGYTAYTRGIMDMRGIVSEAIKVSSPGDTILLSPGASSLNHFANEYERGDMFVKAFMDIKDS